MSDLRAQDCDLLTVGQYLRPDDKHLPVERYYDPGEFTEIEALGMRLGFRHVEAGPFVRSSYHAGEQARAAKHYPRAASRGAVAPHDRASRADLPIDDIWLLERKDSRG
jgi:lipoic acid synthetase